MSKLYPVLDLQGQTVLITGKVLHTHAAAGKDNMISWVNTYSSCIVTAIHMHIPACYFVLADTCSILSSPPLSPLLLCYPHAAKSSCPQ